MAAYNSQVEPEVLDEEDCSVEWTDVSSQPTYVAGEQVEIKKIQTRGLFLLLNNELSRSRNNQLYAYSLLV